MVDIQTPEKMDLELEAKIGDLLVQKGLSQRIHVVAKGGFVHLIGPCKNNEERESIGSWVGEMPGVQLVTNHLHVRGWDEKKEEAHF